jgi:hypothetical protein
MPNHIGDHLMRTSVRLLASTLLGVSLLASIGVGSTLAKGDLVTYDLSDAWCFQNPVEQYCTVEEGALTIETKNDGSTVGRVDLVSTVDVTVDGAFVATYTTRTSQVSRSAPDGSYSFTWSDKTRRTDEEQTCKVDFRVKIVDFRVVTDILKGTCD